MNDNDAIHELLFLVENIKSKFQAILKKVSKDHNITVQQMMILMVVFHKKVNTIGRIAEEFQLHQANVSTLVKHMEAEGMLIRNIDEDDFRINPLSLSPKAEELVQSIYLDLEKKISNAKDSVDVDLIKQGLNEMSSLLQGIL